MQKLRKEVGYSAKEVAEKLGIMIKHYITKYRENGKSYAEAWLQINVFGKCICFAKKKIEI